MRNVWVARLGRSNTLIAELCQGRRCRQGLPECRQRVGAGQNEDPCRLQLLQQGGVEVWGLVREVTVAADQAPWSMFIDSKRRSSGGHDGYLYSDVPYQDLLGPKFLGCPRILNPHKNNK